jgi:hypothetical protein
MIITRSSCRLVILNSRPICVWHPRIFDTCLLWKFRYRVYSNLSYSWSILKVIFLKNNPSSFYRHLQIKMTLRESGRNPPWYRKCWPKAKLLLSKRTFDLYFLISVTCNLSSHIYYMRRLDIQIRWNARGRFRFLSISIQVRFVCYTRHLVKNCDLFIELCTV